VTAVTCRVPDGGKRVTLVVWNAVRRQLETVPVMAEVGARGKKKAKTGQSLLPGALTALLQRLNKLLVYEMLMTAKERAERATLATQWFMALMVLFKGVRVALSSVDGQVLSVKHGFTPLVSLAYLNAQYETIAPD
jgi:hypothetical protein